MGKITGEEVLNIMYLGIQDNKKIIRELHWQTTIGWLLAGAAMLTSLTSIVFVAYHIFTH